MALRQWLQSLRQSSQRKPSHKEPANSTRTFDATTTRHDITLINSLPALTQREVEIVRLLREGYSNKEIAQELGIAVTTVKWNMTNILGKFEVQSSRQLLALLAKLPPTIRASGRSLDNRKPQSKDYGLTRNSPLPHFFTRFSYLCKA